MNTEISLGHSDITNKSLTIHGVCLFRSYFLLGNTIATFTGSKWSHVAVILRDTTATDKNDPKDWFLFEAQEYKDPTPHTQINPYQEVVENYDKDYNGAVSIRPIHFKKDDPSPEIVKSFIFDNIGKPFGKPVSFVKTLFRANREENIDSPICSTLTAYMFQQLGLLPKPENLLSPMVGFSNNYVPKDFSDEGDLKLIGADWGKEEVIHKGLNAPHSLLWSLTSSLWSYLKSWIS